MLIDERNENRKKKVKDFLQAAANGCLPNSISTESNISKENINGQKKLKIKAKKIKVEKVKVKKVKVLKQSSKKVSGYLV